MQERWRMNKLGFVNFWLYDWEEFPFSEGRLLLRGENGAGKSVTTQSFIPFMLDGDLHPYRLDSFGSKDRKMSYYLLGEEKEESTGYLYLEFIKPETRLYRTLVVGLRARRSSSTVEFWGFCLSDGRRIGVGPEDFALFETKGSQHISLTRQEVRNRFGDGENWVERGSDYKQMVNRMLFGCAELEQYEMPCDGGEMIMGYAAILVLEKAIREDMPPSAVGLARDIAGTIKAEMEDK